MIDIADLDSQGPWIYSVHGVSDEYMPQALSATRELIGAGINANDAVRKIAFITACGRFHNAELRDLDSAGINATKRLADYRGETEEKTRTAVSRGEVSDRVLLDALAA